MKKTGQNYTEEKKQFYYIQQLKLEILTLLEKPEIDVNEKSFFSLGNNKPHEKH